MEIEITTHISVEVWKWIVEEGEEYAEAELLELVPGQRLRGRDFRNRGCFEIQKGVIQLPRHAYRKVNPVSAKRFVIAWRTSETRREVALKVGRPICQVLVWERRLRRIGVNIKLMPNRPERFRFN